MIETLPWEEVAGNPDKYIQLLDERETELQRDLFKVRQELKVVRLMKKQKELTDEWRTSGIPDQRKTEAPSDDGEATGASGYQPVTRKTRIMRLIGQDPQRQWKALEVASALNESLKIKSVRVAMDELAKTGSLIKLPNAYYQYAQPQQN